MPQTLKKGTDVTALMSGADVTDLMNQPAPTGGPSIAPGSSPADAIAAMHAYNRAQGLEGGGDGPGMLRLAVDFGNGVVEGLNPLPALHALLTSPVETVAGLGRAQIDQLRTARDLYQAGRTSEAMGHALAGVLPLLGPGAAQAGELIGTGDAEQMARGVGQTAALVAPFGVRAAMDPRMQAAASKAVPAGARTAVADALDRGSTRRMVDVIAPRVGQNKTRFGNVAEEVAPRLAREPELGAASRTGLHGKVQSALEQAEDALDSAADARNAGHAYATQPIIDALLEKRRTLTAEAVEGSRPTRAVSERPSPVLDERGNPITVVEQKAVPIGQDVVPGPNASRVAQIDQAIDEIRRLGPQARYEALRRVRQAYDGPARAVYNPSVTADFLKAQGGKLGAADVTGTLRDALAKFDPKTAAANADYSFFRSANDVLRATEEVERVRPRLGRKIFGSMAGSMTGGTISGPIGAIAGLAVGPIIDATMAAGMTTKIAVARFLAKAADAIRTGDVNAAQRALQMGAKRVGVWQQVAPGVAQLGAGLLKSEPTATHAGSGAP